jgi:hypothetical protein
MFFALVVTSLALLSGPQQDSALPVPQADAQSKPASQQKPGRTIFRVTSREVLVDLIALDDRDHPVLDLKPADLTVSVWWVTSDPSLIDKRHVAPLPLNTETDPITSLHLIDPAKAQSTSGEAQAGLQIATSCLERSTLHYQLALRPGEEGWKSGYHQVAIRTSRPHVRLFYRHDYYVGLVTPPAPSPSKQAMPIEQVLHLAACNYPQIPLSISIQAHALPNDRTDVLRYSVAIDASSLSYLTFGGNETTPVAENAGQDGLRQIQLDYAACNFDGSGKPVSFFHEPLDQTLTDEAYDRAMAEGLPRILQFPSAAGIAVTRFVVRDRMTGNLGAVDIQFSGEDRVAPVQPAIVATMTASDLNVIEEHQALKGYERDADGYGQASHDTIWRFNRPPSGPIGSFGSIVVRPGSFCGDVYELRYSSLALPDFRELDPIGSIYATSLDVPNQNFTNTSGIPGVTPRTNLFGIDYHGTFWVATQGIYRFLMLADDGALLEIDDKEIVDLDGLHQAEAHSAKIYLSEGAHTIHVPYFQGAVTSVALELWVKQPGEGEWKIFDLHDFAPPSEPKKP